MYLYMGMYLFIYGHVCICMCVCMCLYVGIYCHTPYHVRMLMYYNNSHDNTSPSPQGPLSLPFAQPNPHPLPHRTLLSPPSSATSSHCSALLKLFSFPKNCINGIIRYVTFWDGLFSFSEVPGDGSSCVHQQFVLPIVSGIPWCGYTTADPLVGTSGLFSVWGH